MRTTLQQSPLHTARGTAALPHGGYSLSAMGYSTSRSGSTARTGASYSDFVYNSEGLLFGPVSSSGLHQQLQRESAWLEDPGTLLPDLVQAQATPKVHRRARFQVTSVPPGFTQSEKSMCLHTAQKQVTRAELGGGEIC